MQVAYESTTRIPQQSNGCRRAVLAILEDQQLYFQNKTGDVDGLVTMGVCGGWGGGGGWRAFELCVTSDVL